MPQRKCPWLANLGLRPARADTLPGLVEATLWGIRTNRLKFRLRPSPRWPRRSCFWPCCISLRASPH